MEEVKRISNGLSRAGYRVVREKVETVPWHPAAPADSDNMPEGCYFECHFNIRVDAGTNHAILKTIADLNNCHLSKNNFKEYADGSAVLMMTFRSYEDTRYAFTKQVEAIKGKLLMKGFVVEKEIIEFAIFDTKVNHDAQWTGTAAVMKKALETAQNQLDNYKTPAKRSGVGFKGISN